MKKKYVLFSLGISFLLLLVVNAKNLKIDEILNKFSSSTYKTVNTTREIEMKDYLQTEGLSFKINGETIEPNHLEEVSFGSSFRFDFQWEIPKELEWTAADVFVYELPSQIKFDNANGKLKDKAREVGEYELVDNRLTVLYYDSFVQENKGKSNIVGTLYAEGVLNDEKLWQEDGTELELVVPGFETFDLLITPDIKYSDLILAKWCNDRDLNDDKTSFQINIASIRHNFNEIVIEDTYGHALSNLRNLRIYDKNLQDITDNVEITEKDSSFEIIIRNAKVGDSFTIDYNLDITEEIDTSSSDMENKVVATVQNKYSSMSFESAARASAKEKSDVSKSVTIDGKTATYTIEVYGKSDLLGSILTDTLGECQRYIDGTFQVTENGWVTNAFTFEQLQDGYEFTENDVRYTITYNTEITCGACYIKNYVKLESSTGTLEEDETSVYVNDATLSKEAIDYDKENRIITWESIFTFENGTDIEESLFSLTDEFDESELEYVANSFQINGINYNVSQLEWTQGFDFSDSVSHLGEGPYIITYQTKVKPNIDVLSLKNEISVRLNGKTYSATATYSEDELNISKLYVSDRYTENKYRGNFWGSSCIDEDARCMQYVIKIKRLDNNIKNFYIVDRLPDDTTGVVEDVYLSPLNNQELADYFNNPWNVTQPILIEKMDDNKIKISFQDATILDYLKQDDYFLSYKVYADESLYGAHTFTNTAYPVMDGEEGNMTSSVAEKVFDPPITKEVDYDKDTAPAAQYTIELNDYALDLDPESDELILMDELGSGLDFVRGTLRVNDQLWQDYNYDDETRKLIIKVPDETKLKLTYTVYVNLSPGTQFTHDNSYNSIKIDNIDGSPSVELHGEVLEVKGTTSSTSGSITIYKYLNNNRNNGLGEIEFQIYQANTIVENETVIVDSNHPLGAEVASTVTSNQEDLRGYASVHDLNFDQVYVIHEMKREGYEPIDDIYFVITKQDHIKYDKNIHAFSSNVINPIININNNQTGKVQILKVDENDILLKNAQLQIKDKTGKVIENWTTDGKEHDIVANLIVGETYTLHEVSAPNGYDLADDIEFTIQNTETLQQIKMIDKRKKSEEDIEPPDTGDEEEVNPPNTGDKEEIESPNTRDKGILQYIMTIIVVILLGFTFIITSLERNRKSQ